MFRRATDSPTRCECFPHWVGSIHTCLYRIGISSCVNITNGISPLSLSLLDAQHLDNWTHFKHTASLGFIPKQPLHDQAMQEMRGCTTHGRESRILLRPEWKSLLFCAASSSPSRRIRHLSDLPQHLKAVSKIESYFLLRRNGIDARIPNSWKSQLRCGCRTDLPPSPWASSG